MDEDSEPPNSLSPISLADCKNSYVTLHRENLTKIIGENGSNFKIQHPLVILSVVGDRNSGKSFLLNLLIHYLRSEGNGNWMNEFKASSFIPGFKINDEDSQIEDYVNRIYAWPEIFTYDNGQKVSVMLLDIVTPKDSAFADQNCLLEDLLCIWSSVIIDNRTTNFKPNILESLARLDDFLSSTTSTWIKRGQGQTIKSSRDFLCKNFNFVIRDFSATVLPYNKSSDKTIEYLRNNLTKYCPEMSSKFENLDEKAVLFLKPHQGSSAELSPNADMKKFLATDSKLSSQLKILCSNIMDSLTTKNIPDGVTLYEYIVGCVDIVNRCYMKGSIDNTCSNTSSGSIGESKTMEIGPDTDVNMTDLSPPPPLPQTAAPTFNTICSVSGIDEKDSIYAAGHKEQDKILLNSGNQATAGVNTSTTELIFKPQPTQQNKYSPLTLSKVTPSQVNCGEISQPVHIKKADENDINNAFLDRSTLTDKIITQNTQEIDEAVQNKVQKLKTRFQNLLQNATDSCDAHENKMTEEIITEFSQFLIKVVHLKEEQKSQAITMLRNSLTLVRDKMQMPSNYSDTVKSETSPLYQPNSTCSLKEHKKRLHLSTSSSEAFVGQTMENLGKMLLETDIDKVAELQDQNPVSGTHDSSQDDMMDTSEPTDAETERSLWVNAIQSTYEKSMNLLVKNHMSQNMFLAEEDFEIYHLKVVCCENMGFHKLQKNHTELKKLTIPTVDCEVNKVEQIQSVVQDCQRKIWTDVEKENSTNQKRLEKIINNFQSSIQSNSNQWISQVTCLDGGNRRNGAQEFVNRMLNNALPTNYNYSMKSLMVPALKQVFQHWERIFIILENAFDLYREKMEMQFEKFCLLVPSKLLAVHAQQTELVFKHLGAPFKEDANRELADCGLKKLKLQYQDRSNAIQSHEVNSARKLQHKVVDFHRKMLQELCKDSILNQDNLKLLNEIVIQETIEAFTKSCNHLIREHRSEIINEFQQKFKTAFDAVVSTNSMRMTKINLKMKLFVTKCRNQYNDQMSEFLPARGPSRDNSDLNRKHFEVLNQVSKLLKMEIENLKVKIPPDESVTDLQAKIDADWIEIKGHNSQLKTKEVEVQRKQMENIEKQKRDEEKESKKREAQEKLEKLTHSQHKAETTTTNFSDNAHTQSPNVVIKPSSSSTGPSSGVEHLASPPPPQELPPIAIEFGFNMVRVGYIDGDHLELIQDEISTYVVVDEKNEIFVGREAIEKPNNIALDHAIREPDEKGYSLNATTLSESVTSEVLVALFLSKLKRDVEQCLGGIWTIAVISVPLCFTSVQRKAMKDSATIAGFTKTYLINDTSAAAFYVANINPYNENKQSMCILSTVFSENHFDAAFYHNQSGKIEMLDSCGNMHASFELPQKLILKRFWNYIKSKVTMAEEKGGALSLFKSMVKEQDKDTIVNIDCNYGGDKRLENIVKTYGRPAHIKCKPQHVIIFGTSIFAKEFYQQEPLAKAFIMDKASYTFIRNRPIELRKIKPPVATLFEPYQRLNTSKIPDSQIIGTLQHSSIATVFTEVSGKNAELFCGDVGSLFVKQDFDSSLKFEQYRIKVSLSSEGIFNIEGVVVPTRGFPREIKLEFEWTSPNLKDNAILKYTELVKSIQKDEKKEAIEKSKKELQNLIDRIRRVGLETVTKMIIKQYLETGLVDAEVLVKHPNATQEKLDTKIKVLEGLERKYLTK